MHTYLEEVVEMINGISYVFLIVIDHKLNNQRNLEDKVHWIHTAFQFSRKIVRIK